MAAIAKCFVLTLNIIVLFRRVRSWPLLAMTYKTNRTSLTLEIRIGDVNDQTAKKVSRKLVQNDVALRMYVTMCKKSGAEWTINTFISRHDHAVLVISRADNKCEAIQAPIFS